MTTKERLLEGYLARADEEQKALMITEVIGFLQESTMRQTKALTQLAQERDALRDKVGRAAALIEEAQVEAAKAQKAALNETRKKLQIARDRLAAIAQTARSLGEQINSNGGRAAMIDTVNNILASADILTEELSRVGLWDANEDKPDFTPVEAKKPIKKKAPRKKPDPSSDQLQF